MRATWGHELFHPHDGMCSRGHRRLLHIGVPIEADRANDDYRHRQLCHGVLGGGPRSARGQACRAGVTMVSLSSGYEVFTQRFGESDAVKVLVLHGGPACTHEYMLNVAYQMPGHPTLSDLGNAEVHMYDQLRSFYSDQPTEDFWNIDRWVEEVEEVRVALGLDSDNFTCLETAGEASSPWSTLWFTKTTSKDDCVQYAIVHSGICCVQCALRPQMRPSPWTL